MPDCKFRDLAGGQVFLLPLTSRHRSEGLDPAREASFLLPKMDTRDDDARWSRKHMRKGLLGGNPSTITIHCTCDGRREEGEI